VTIVGQRFQSGHTLIGKTIKSFTVYLKKQGSPTGNLEAKIINSSNTEKASFGTLDVDEDLTTSFVQKTFTFVSATTNNIIDADDRISLHYSGGSSGNAARVELCSSCDIDYTNEGYYVSSWAERTGSMRMTVTYGSPDKATLVTATELVADQDDGWVHIDQSPNQEYLYDSGNPSDTWNFLHDGSTYSVSLWVYRNGAQGANEPCYLSTGGASADQVGADLYSDNTSNGTAYWVISDGTGSDTKQVTVGNIPNTTWTNIIITNDGTDLKAYLNGTLSNTTSLSGFTPATTDSNYKLFVGRNNRGGTDMANVKFSMAGFWDTHVLSADDITKLSGGRRPRADGVGFDYSSSNIVHLYPFNNADDLLGDGTSPNLDLSNHYGRATYSTNQSTAPTTSASISEYSSNLPENTLFEETDTRLYYWQQDGVWQPTTPLISDNFDSSPNGWTFSASSTITGGYLNATGGSNNYKAFTIGTDIKCVLDLDWSVGNSPNSPFVILSSDKDDTGYGNPASGHKKIQMFFANGDTMYVQSRNNSGSGNVESTGTVASVPTADTIKYYRFRLNATDKLVEFIRYPTDADRRNGTNAEATISGLNNDNWNTPFLSGTADLAYISVGGYSSGANKLYDMKLWLGVDSI